MEGSGASLYGEVQWLHRLGASLFRLVLPFSLLVNGGERRDLLLFRLMDGMCYCRFSVLALIVKMGERLSWSFTVCVYNTSDSLMDSLLSNIDLPCPPLFRLPRPTS